MPEAFKFHAPLRLAMEIREASRKSGRTISDTLVRAVEQGLGAEPPVMEEAIVDRVERGSKGSRSIAAYLSQPLSSAIQRLANEHQRSASWTMRLLIREALRARYPTNTRRRAVELIAK
jgi:hypothetical protein